MKKDQMLEDIGKASKHSWETGFIYGCVKGVAISGGTIEDLEKQLKNSELNIAMTDSIREMFEEAQQLQSVDPKPKTEVVTPNYAVMAGELKRKHENLQAIYNAVQHDKKIIDMEGTHETLNLTEYDLNFIGGLLSREMSETKTLIEQCEAVQDI